MMHKNHNTYLYILSAVVTVLAYLVNKNNWVNVSVACVLAGILLSIVDIRKGSIFFFVVSLAFSDYTFEGVFGQEGSEEGSSLGGIYMASVGGSTLMVYWGIVNLGLLLLKQGNWALNSIKQNMILRIFSYVIFFSFIGLIFNLNSIAREVSRTAISDIRLFVNMILGFLTVLLIVRDKTDLRLFFNIFILTFLLNLLLTIISSYSVSQVRTISNFFSGTESYLLGTAFLFLMLNITNKDSSMGLFSNKIVNLSGMLLIVLFLFVVASRGKMLGLGFSVVAFMIFSRKFGYAIALPILSVISIYLVHIINPNFYDYFMWKFTTFNPMQEGGESSKIRYVSLINILRELSANPYYFFFGKGLGGFFEDKYLPFGTLLANGGFSTSWIAEGRFYKPHGIILYSLLKYGVVMSILIFYSIVRFCYSNLKLIRGQKKDGIWIITVSLLINLPFFFTIMYSSKLQLMFGMIVGFSICCLKILSVRTMNTTGRILNTQN